MKPLVFSIVLGFASAVASAQNLDDLNLQIHGFATQGIVCSGANNYLSMNTSSGSTAWTEAAVNVNDQVSEKLRIGVQFHFTRLGNFGGDTLNVDWALGDYKINRWVGVRAGKVKIRWGLYNDTQDYDPGYLWSLLPEPVYGVDWRSTNLSQLGAEVYGRVPTPKRLGKVDYTVCYGNYFYAADDGTIESFKEQGLTFANLPGGKTPGFDLRWSTPVAGLKVGGSLMMYDAKGTLTNGVYNQPLAYWPTYYAQYDFKKLFLSGQYVKLVQYQTITMDETAPETSGSDTRSWFVTAGYHATDKLQVGAYYSHYVVASAADQKDPANYFHDWVVSSRYDINSFFYAKVEGHFMDGDGVGFYGVNNPNGLRPRTNLVVGKIGFTF